MSRQVATLAAKRIPITNVVRVRRKPSPKWSN